MTRVNRNFSFKMYIIVNDIIGEKRIDLTYSTNSTMEIAVIGMISDNTQYEIKEPLDLKMIGNDGKWIPNKTNDLMLNLTPENVTQHSRIE